MGAARNARLRAEFVWRSEAGRQVIPMSYSFFATVARMKYINRWALMRNAREENLSEHSLEVAMLAHALCTIGNVRYGRHLDADRAAIIGLYHDVPEIITGDMPTPVKYANERIRHAYRDVEEDAEQHLLEKLPEDLRAEYEKFLCTPKEMSEAECYMRKLVKAADKLSALIKCMEEKNSGNQEFRSAETGTRAAIETMADELPEVGDFLREFLPAYGKTLDELTRATEETVQSQPHIGKNV